MNEEGCLCVYISRVKMKRALKEDIFWGFYNN